MEIWKDIIGYEGIYQVSNEGNIKSLKRKGVLKDKILKPTLDINKYLKVSLYINKSIKTKFIHQLIAENFLNHTPCGHKLVVDHIDNNPLNNRLNNIKIVTTRENTSKNRTGSSEYTGVSWRKDYRKWHSQIRINKKAKHLGYFTDELEAAEAYKIALNNL
tara:strand:+ start:37 stop:519 length:483 start_codon:yes stop_codon:yes gene_type:complete